MKDLLTTVRERFPQLVIAGVLLGFALILAELVLIEHTEKKQLVAIGATLLGAAAAGAGLAAPAGFRGAIAVALVFAGLAGIPGTVLHYAEAREEAEKRLRKGAESLLPGGPAHASEEHEEDEKKKKEHHGPPPLAPLSVTGLGLLGALAVLARRDAAEA
ncbi:MAG: hypothetical protein FJZ01_10330 [Candidatus Sericytochromatia bacterium]|nr:hypothetical protein [Candidatus Tanganyikabacteria bacterium]